VEFKLSLNEQVKNFAVAVKGVSFAAVTKPVGANKPNYVSVSIFW